MTAQLPLTTDHTAHLTEHEWELRRELLGAVDFLFMPMRRGEISNLHSLETRLGLLIPAMRDAVLHQMELHCHSHSFKSRAEFDFDQLTAFLTQECETQREELESEVA